jgi:hypothetical protein
MQKLLHVQLCVSKEKQITEAILKTKKKIISTQQPKEQ